MGRTRMPGCVRLLVLVGLLCTAMQIGTPTMAHAVQSEGELRTNVPTGQETFTTLASNTSWRWNANASRLKGSVIHLDDVNGDNCRFRFDHIEGGWYGTKHIKTGGTDLFADVDGKSRDPGAVIHLWASGDGSVKGNDHRQFAFCYQYTSDGNDVYCIKNRKSGLWLAADKDTWLNNCPKILQTDIDHRDEWIITSSTVPLKGGDTNILKNGHASGVIQINKAGSAGTGIDLWNRQSLDKNESTSQLWRFIDQGGGRYKLMSVRTGRCLQETRAQPSEANNFFSLVTGTKGTFLTVSVLDGDAGTWSNKVNLPMPMSG